MANEVALTKSSITQANYDYDAHIKSLTPEDKKNLLALTQKIDTHDISTIQNYGSELSTVISQNADSLLRSVRSNNSDAIVEMTNNLLAELNLINVDELNTNSTWKNFVRKLPIVGRMVTSVESIMNKYDTVAENVDKIAKKIDTTKVVAVRDNTTLETIFNNNKQYIDDIRNYIVAAKLRDEELSQEIAIMQSRPQDYEAYEVQDAINFQASLEKRIADMQVNEQVLVQNLYQIRATQISNVAIANKSDNLVNNIIPLWRNQLAIAVIMNNQKASIEAQQKISEATNSILQKNAENLKVNAINAAKANEETVISLETLKTTNNELIEMVKEVRRVGEEGHKNRVELEKIIKENSLRLENAIDNNK